MRLVLAFVVVIALSAMAAVEAVPAAPAPAKTVVAAKSKKRSASAKPGAASLAAVKKLPKAPKTELRDFVRANNPSFTGARVHSIYLYLKSQQLFTLEDLLKLSSDGIRALTVPEAVRIQFTEELIKHIAKTRNVDDGLPVYMPQGMKKSVPPTVDGFGCPIVPRFAQIPVNNAAPSPVGDWLRRAYPTIKPLQMSRSILALQRQTVRSFADLRAIAGDPPLFEGIDKLLYVPVGVREALREALLYHIGTEGYDDGKPVYVVPNPALKPWPAHCSHGVAQYAGLHK